MTSQSLDALRSGARTFGGLDRKHQRRLETGCRVKVASFMGDATSESHLILLHLYFHTTCNYMQMLCVYIYMCVCACVCVCVCVCLSIHLFIHVYLCMCVCVCVRVLYACMYLRAYVYMYVRSYLHMYRACLDVCMHGMLWYD